MNKITKYFITAIILILFIGLIIVRNLPAGYISEFVNEKSNGRVRLVNTNGNIWKGSGYLALAYGWSDNKPKIIDSPISWDCTVNLFNWNKTKIFVHNSQINSGMGVDIYPIAKINKALKVEIPAQILQGLAGPFSSLELYGNITLNIPQISWKAIDSSTLVNIKLQNMYSQKLPQKELGSYNIDLQLGKNSMPFTINTLSGILKIEGQGTLKPMSIDAQASVHEYYKQDLMPLLIMLGKLENNKVNINL